MLHLPLLVCLSLTLLSTHILAQERCDAISICWRNRMRSQFGDLSWRHVLPHVECNKLHSYGLLRARSYRRRRRMPSIDHTSFRVRIAVRVTSLLSSLGCCASDVYRVRCDEDVRACKFYEPSESCKLNDPTYGNGGCAFGTYEANGKCNVFALKAPLVNHSEK